MEWKTPNPLERAATYTPAMELLWLLASVAAFLAIVLLGLALVAFSRRHTGGGVAQVLLSLLLLAFAGILALVAVGMNGYQTFVGERTVATVDVSRRGEQQYIARFQFPGGEERTFRLAGDQLYVDARILKWHPRANLLGLRTGYRLDRVAGRYLSLDDEQNSPRTVYSLGQDAAPVDLFEMARRYEVVSRLVDAEYGSATFLDLRDGASYQVKVSNSGLLIREIALAD